MVTGYREDVEWIESAAFELMYLSRAQEYRQAKSFESRLYRQYQDITASLGFLVYPA